MAILEEALQVNGDTARKARGLPEVSGETHAAMPGYGVRLSRVGDPKTIGSYLSRTPDTDQPTIAELEANVPVEIEADRSVDPGRAHLTITIIGAGIAGLVCALALRKDGHRVTLLEKSSFSKHKETGAATSVGPNASGLLLRLGFNFEAAGANVCEGFLSMNGVTGEIKNKQNLEWAKEAYKRESVPGNVRPWALCHRVDLHNELKRLVFDPRGSGPVPEMHLGATVEHVDTETAEVKLADGRVFAADSVIGADGNNSFTRYFVEPDAKLKPWGKSCYRWLVPRASLLLDHDTKQFVQETGYFADVAGPDRKLIMYPCRKNTMVNFAAIVPDDEMETAGGEDWEHKGRKEGLMKSFENFCPETRKLLHSAGDDLRVWQLMHITPLNTFVKGRVALIGDAAHPFLPFLGQGAAQAMEDAVCIANIFQESTLVTSGADSVPELLKLYDSIRRERANWIAAQTERNGLQEGEGGPPPSFVLEMLDNCFKHDEWDNTNEKLADWHARKSDQKDA
ncbi:Putative FAD-binding domain, FAD/NAD(P)-binding domain superfamily [Septoria linicola]|uniref:FAD-binding domain, FAD/NAD(P)-binding domain superfamily n=1 Tax=Septoria linicola TaxID=215465 RepID=A0A9Q9B1C5_9PEZI|nr:Putative FAD-binding domain, FAD/NAD(P)-binding domain superfamily [Septoria linicola]